MTENGGVLINVPRSDGTTDAEKYKKDCPNFKCLEDGTLTGEYRYCNHSTICRQIGFVAGKAVPMLSNQLPVRDPYTGEVVEMEYFCTGMYDYRSLNERQDDDDVS